MAVGDIYQIVMKYVDGWNVEMQARFNYRQTIGQAGAADDLDNAFWQTVVAKWRDLSLTTTFITSVEYVNIAFPDDYYNPAIPGGAAGNRTATSEKAPSWLALSFKSNRAQPGTRHGRKRFGGLQELDFAGNFFSNAFVTGSLVTALANVMAAVITTSNSSHSFEPVVVKSGYKLGTVPVLRYRILQYGAETKVSKQDTRRP